MNIFFKDFSPYHGEQFCTVSGSMRRLTLLLINLVKTLEITTKQLKKYNFTHTQTKTNSKEDKNPSFLVITFLYNQQP